MAKRDMPEKKPAKKATPLPARKKKVPKTYFGLKKIAYKSPKDS